MSTITASEVNKLRQQTGAPLMDCKKALVESNGDFEAAIDYLRKKGQKVSAMRSEREAKEGVVYALTNETHNIGVAVNLGCETDFVAKSADFIAFAKLAAEQALKNNTQNADELKALKVDGVSLADRTSELVGKIGEKIELKKVEWVKAHYVVAYIHMGYKMAVLVGFDKQKSEKLESTGKDVAMQIAAMNPVAVHKDHVSQDIIDRELDVAREKAKADGKPDNLIDKIAAGALQKYFKENSLLSQQFVKDGNKTVDDVLKEVDKDLKVTEFKRVTLN
jgi:elongation factor Ts